MLSCISINEMFSVVIVSPCLCLSPSALLLAGVDVVTFCAQAEALLRTLFRLLDPSDTGRVRVCVLAACLDIVPVPADRDTAWGRDAHATTMGARDPDDGDTLDAQSGDDTPRDWVQRALGLVQWRILEMAIVQKLTGPVGEFDDRCLEGTASKSADGEDLTWGEVRCLNVQIIVKA